MRRYLLLAIVLIVLLSCALTIRVELRDRDKKKREVAYQSALQSYSQNVTLGWTRKKVEAYFKARDIAFGQMGWLEEQPEDRTAFADLIKVGHEDAPWYCSENYVYIAFQFSATEPHRPWMAAESDVLTKVRIYRQLGGCL